MTSRNWQTELLRFQELDQMGRLRWLSNILFQISMLARNTYEAGTSQVSKPDDLRRFNELIHRLATFMKKVAYASPNGLPDDALFRLLEAQLKELDVDTEHLFLDLGKVS